jgi:hypothetical protein
MEEMPFRSLSRRLKDGSLTTGLNQRQARNLSWGYIQFLSSLKRNRPLRSKFLKSYDNDDEI